MDVEAVADEIMEAAGSDSLFTPSGREIIRARIVAILSREIQESLFSP